MTKEEQRLKQVCVDYAKIVATLYRDLNDARQQIDDLNDYNKKLRKSLTSSENARQNWRNLAKGLQGDNCVQLGREPCDERPVDSKDTTVGV